MERITQLGSKVAMLFLLSTIGCALAGPAADELNPYGEGNFIEEKGNRDQSALTGVGGGSKEGTAARQALEVMGSYRRALPPQPTYPVIQPAEVRLMWVPDHLDRHGNMVPANYYYLRVLNDRWAVQDAFELEYQLRNNPGIDYSGGGGGGGGGGGAAAGPGPTSTYGTNGGQGSSTPWVYKEE